MKKVFAAAVLAATIASPALATHFTTDNPNRNGVFNNRGQCQSTLVRARNGARKAGNTALFSQLNNARCSKVSAVNLTQDEFLAANVSPPINAQNDASKFVVDFLSNN